MCIRDRLDSAYYINAGGCCYCASLIARELEARKIKYKLIIYDPVSYTHLDVYKRQNLKRSCLSEQTIG